MDIVREYIRARIVIEDRGHDTACWIWQLSKSHGYGQGRPPGRPQEQAHRFSYREFVGEIPEGLHLDHLCRVRECCNPDHLEPVTPQENARRALPFMVWEKRTHCKNGHEFSDQNTYVTPRGERRCRQCNRDWQRARGYVGVHKKRSPVKNPKSHCEKGHELTPENTIVWKGARRCRACNIAWRAERDDHRARQRRYREERRAAARKDAGGGCGVRQATAHAKGMSRTHSEGVQ